MILSNDRYLKILSDNNEEQNNFFGEKTILFKDFLGEGITTLFNATSKVMKNKLRVEFKYIQKGIGYEWNIINNKIANNSCEEMDDNIIDSV